MIYGSFFIRLNQLDSSYLIVLSLAGVALAAIVLIYTGLLGCIMRALGRVVDGSIRHGFSLWELLFSGISWPWFLAIVVGLLLLGWTMAGVLPGLTILCALAPMFMGLTACLAYMFIDQERYQVGRGHKAVHNPLKGQELAQQLVRYGQQVGVPLLAAATTGMIGGFALLNQGLYQSIGRDWYVVGKEPGEAEFVDFLAYALIHLLRLVDILNVAGSHRLLEVTYVRQAAWQASVLLALFQTFFTFVLLQQVFASIRLVYLLGETIMDFWSPHEPIHERARNALPQYGPRAIEPLLLSLRSIDCLNKEQREQLPPILAAIGPAAIPSLIRRLHDPHEQMRALAVAALGHLHTVDELPLLVPLLVPLAQDPSDMVRQNLVEALGLLGAASVDPDRTGRRRCRNLRSRAWWLGRWFHWRAGSVSTPKNPARAPAPSLDPIDATVSTLRYALADSSAAVRSKAANALGRIGPRAAEAAPDLIALLKDRDEIVRCEAAESLGKVRGSEETAVNALIELLQDHTPAVKASAARALGALKEAAAPAVVALVPLLQDLDESVRTTAAEAIGQVGALDNAAKDSLVQGLGSADDMVRAQTAIALGTIGDLAQETAPALVEALADANDRVRAKAVQALGKIGDGAAEVAVPSLMRALRDQDNGVSALAAEALGQMGDSADEAVPALMRALWHINRQVRGNAAESLGKLGVAALRARGALEGACRDEDGTVRSQAVRALGALGPAETSWHVVLTGLQDPVPQVRAAAVEAIGLWDEANEAALGSLMVLLKDPNDQVKVQVAQVLPRLAGATPSVIDGLCCWLLEDDSILVQFHAAQALSKLGPAAAAAGPSLLQAAQTAEASVREQAMRAIAMIQPPEAGVAFVCGLKDADGEIRKMASAGLRKAAAVPEEIIPALVEALRDPEVQVRANVAHALARLDVLPAAAVPLLIACTADASDGLRLNAALALKQAAAASGAALEVIQQLVEDVNLRIRLVAASVLLPMDPSNAKAIAALAEALGDAAVGIRQAALEIVQSLGPARDTFLDMLRLRAELEEEPDLRQALIRFFEQIDGVPVTLIEGA